MEWNEYVEPKSEPKVPSLYVTYLVADEDENLWTGYYHSDSGWFIYVANSCEAERPCVPIAYWAEIPEVP